MSKLPTEVSEFMLDCLEYEHNENVIIKEDVNPDWIRHEANLASLLLDIDVPVRDIERECYAFAETHEWVKHNGDRHPGWKSLTIHGQGWDISNTPENYDMPFEGWHWTEMADACPITKQWLCSLPWSNWQRIRFMLLEPGGYILPHADTPDSRLGPINISITNPPECHFFMEGAGEIPWEPGQVRLMNVGKLHSVYNNSDKPRLHMIIHAMETDHEVLDPLMMKAYKKIYYGGLHNPSTMV